MSLLRYGETPMRHCVVAAGAHLDLGLQLRPV